MTNPYAKLTNAFAHANDNGPVISLKEILNKASGTYTTASYGNTLYTDTNDSDVVTLLVQRNINALLESATMNNFPELVKNSDTLDTQHTALSEDDAHYEAWNIVHDEMQYRVHKMVSENIIDQATAPSAEELRTTLILAMATNNQAAVHDIALFAKGKAEYDAAITDGLRFGTLSDNAGNCLTVLCETAEPSIDQLALLEEIDSKLEFSTEKRKDKRLWGDHSTAAINAIHNAQIAVKVAIAKQEIAGIPNPYLEPEEVTAQQAAAEVEANAEPKHWEYKTPRLVLTAELPDYKKNLIRPDMLSLSMS